MELHSSLIHGFYCGVCKPRYYDLQLLGLPSPDNIEQLYLVFVQLIAYAVKRIEIVSSVDCLVPKAFDCITVFVLCYQHWYVLPNAYHALAAKSHAQAARC